MRVTDGRTDGQNYDPKTALAWLLRAVKTKQCMVVIAHHWQLPSESIVRRCTNDTTHDPENYVKILSVCLTNVCTVTIFWYHTKAQSLFSNQLQFQPNWCTVFNRYNSSWGPNHKLAKTVQWSPVSTQRWTTRSAMSLTQSAHITHNLSLWLTTQKSNKLCITCSLF